MSRIKVTPLLHRLFIPFHLLDVPRMVIESTGAPITNQSDTKNESGTYLLPSLQFTTEATVEAWEVYAEYPGRIQLQVRLNTNNTTRTTFVFS